MWSVTADEAHHGADPLGEAREATSEAIGAARGRAERTREAAGERIDATREATERQLRDARDGVADAAVGVAQKLPKPRLRGVSHQWAFFASLLAAAALIVAAQGTREVVAISVYVVSLSALLGTSALYHRVTWGDGARRWMRRLDHTMIFVLIAGTYTPFAVLVMEGTLAEVVLIGVWALAVGGAVLTSPGGTRPNGSPPPSTSRPAGSRSSPCRSSGRRWARSASA